MDMRTILLGLAVLALTTAADAATPPAKASFEIRLIVECKPGDATLALIGSNEELCLAKDKVLDGSDIIRVDRYPTVPKAVIEITQAAADHLFEVTSTGDGEQRLGFVFNGKLIFAPYVGSPIKIKQLPLTLKNDPDDIDALVAAFPGDMAAK
jgi:hypothetical protein